MEENLRSDSGPKVSPEGTNHKDVLVVAEGKEGETKKPRSTFKRRARERGVEDQSLLNPSG